MKTPIQERYCQARKTLFELESVILQDILLDVSKNENIKIRAIKGKTQIRSVTDARHIYCYIARKITDFSLEVIGEKINRSKASVYKSIKVVEDLIELNNTIKKYD